MPRLLKNLKINTIGSVDRPANGEATVVLMKRDISKAMKTENGQEFPKAAYAYTPSDEPSTWKLRLWETPETKETAKQVGMAVAALGTGFRGNKVEIPEVDLPAVKAKVRAAWKKVNPDKSADEMPEAIRKSDEPSPMQKLWNFAKGLFGPGDNSGGAKDLSTILTEEERDNTLWKLTSALRQSLDSILEDDTVTDKQTAIAQVLQQFVSALLGSGVAKAGRKISTNRMQMLKQMKEMLDQLIIEAEPEPGNNVDKRKEENTLPISEEVRKSLPEEARAYIEELEKKAAGNSPAPEPAPNNNSGQDDIWKGVSPEVRKRMEDLEKRANDAEALAKAIKEEQKNKEYLAKAASLTYLGVPVEDLVSVMKAIDGNQELMTKFEGILNAANEQIQKGALFTEIGRSGAGNTGNVVAKAEALAAEMVQKNAGMTKEQAISKVWLNNPDLYAEYCRELEGGRK